MSGRRLVALSSGAAAILAAGVTSAILVAGSGAQATPPPVLSPGTYVVPEPSTVTVEVTTTEPGPTTTVTQTVPGTTTGPTASPWLSGTFHFSGSDANLAAVQAFEDWRNRPAAFVLDYMGGGTTWNHWTTLPSWVAFWSGKYRVHLSPGMWPKDAAEGTFTLAQGAAGAYDSHWTDLARNLVAAGMADTIITPGHEFTGNWYPYTICAAVRSTTYSPTRAADFAAYYRRIVTAMRAVSGQDFTFLYGSSNGWNCPASGVNILDAAYPGDAYVDALGRDFYDRCFSTAAVCADPVQRWSKTTLNGTNRLAALAEFQSRHPSKPLLFPEWGLTDTTHDGFGDNPYFVTQAHEFFASHDTLGESYFNVNSGDGFKHELFPSTQYPNARAKYLELFGG